MIDLRGRDASRIKPAGAWPGRSNGEETVMDVPVGLVNHRRSDFLRMMRQLGADPGVSYCRFDAAAGEIRDIQHVYLRCRYEEWVKAFGEPEAVSPPR